MVKMRFAVFVTRVTLELATS